MQIFFNLHSGIGSDIPTEIQLTKSQEDSISRDKIVVRELDAADRPGKIYESTGLIKASVNEVYSVLTDFKSYNEFMPNNEETKILRINSQSALLNITLALPLKKVKKYRLQMDFERKKGVAFLKWKNVDWPGLSQSQTIRETHGFWLIQNFPKKKSHVLAVYHVYIDPGPIPWGLGWIVNLLSRYSIPDIIIKTRNRVYEINGGMAGAE